MCFFEKALTYEAIDRNDKAAGAFSCLASRYPKSVQARKAMINLALTYSKAGKMEQAADTYKEIIRTGRQARRHPLPTMT